MTPEEVLVEIKKEIQELMVIEENKRLHHKEVTKDKAGEYFYRGRLAYMKHLLNVINFNEWQNKEEK